MKYVIMVAVATLCGVLVPAGCSKKTPPAENPQASENQQSSPAPAAEVVVLNEANFDSQIGQGIEAYLSGLSRH